MSRSDVLKGLVKGLNFLSSCETPIGAAQQRIVLCRFSLPSILVHRGISPESIVVCKDRNKMTPKIADFDLAKKIVDGNCSTHSGSGVDDWKPPDEEVTVKIAVIRST